jgi:hypothetical protein
VIKSRHSQQSIWEGLFVEEVAQLWELRMRAVDELLEDAEIIGPSTPNLLKAKINRAMMEAAKKCGRARFEQAAGAWLRFEAGRSPASQLGIISVDSVNLR